MVSLGISSTLSPKALVTGHIPDNHNYFELEFGTYVQKHEMHINSMAPQQLVYSQAGINYKVFALVSQ